MQSIAFKEKKYIRQTFNIDLMLMFKKSTEVQLKKTEYLTKKYC